MEGADESTAGVQDPNPRDPAISSPMFLIVDDDADVCIYLRRCLGPLTSHVREASSGEEALEFARGAADLAIVIADVVMPGMDGLALRAAMRADAALAHLPVLLISGAPIREISGPVLEKPFGARKLRATVQALLNL